MSYRSETAKVRARVARFIAPPVVDIGCGPDLVVPEAVGVDRAELPHISLVADLNAPLPFRDWSFETVFSSHALEHLIDPAAALRDWVRILRPGGRLILYLPHADLYLQPNPEHLHEMRPEGVAFQVRLAGCDVIHEETDDAGPEFYSFLTVGRKR